jgi:hypothetical protein
MSWNRDRDLDGVPDWQEDENYADEAPIRGRDSPRARMGRVGGGCALPAALLLATAALATRRATRRRPDRGPSGRPARGRRPTPGRA